MAGKYVLLWSCVCERLKTHFGEATDTPQRTRSIMSVSGSPVKIPRLAFTVKAATLKTIIWLH